MQATEVPAWLKPRKAATEEAKHRRRENRRLRSAARKSPPAALRKSTAMSARRLRWQEIARRAVRLFYTSKNRPLASFLQIDYRYWMARGCGWDACSDEHARDGRGSKCDPHDGAMWIWWKSLYYESQDIIVRDFRANRGRVR